MTSPDLPRRLAWLTCASLAAPPLAAPPLAVAQPLPPENTMAEPHARVPEPLRAAPMPAGAQHPVAIWTRLLMGMTGGVVALRA